MLQNHIETKCKVLWIVMFYDLNINTINRWKLKVNQGDGQEYHSEER